MQKIVDIVGNTYGRLIVESVATKEDRSHLAKSTRNRAHFWCVCTCGNKVMVNSGNLRNGVTKSCGCLAAEKASMRLKAIHDTNCFYKYL